MSKEAKKEDEKGMRKGKQFEIVSLRTANFAIRIKNYSSKRNLSDCKFEIEKKFKTKS
jgi:hypothetical protein